MTFANPDDGDKQQMKQLYEGYESKLLECCSNERLLVDYVIYCYYKFYPNYSKALMWNVFGNQILRNIKAGAYCWYKIVEDDNGQEYFGKKYSLKECALSEL